jgi:hypothetical protein
MSIPAARLYCLLIGLVAVGPSQTQAQELKPEVSARLGFIRNWQDDPDQPRYAFYPELEATTVIIRSERRRLALRGGIYAGGWSDGVETPSRCADCITYAYNSIIVGARLKVTQEAFPLERFPIPLSLWGGAARHFLFVEYVGGAGVAGNVGHDHRSAHYALEAGTRLQVPISRRLRLGGDIQISLALPADPNNPHALRLAYSLVTTYAPR